MIVILPIEIKKLEEKSYHLFIKVEFSENIIGDVVIDTGASKTVFDKTFVEKFIKETKDNPGITSSGINQNIEDIEFVSIEKIKLGKLCINDFNTAVMDLSHINKVYEKFGDKYIAGLIGSDFLVKYKAVISYKEKKLILEA